MAVGGDFAREILAGDRLASGLADDPVEDAAAWEVVGVVDE